MLFKKAGRPVGSTTSCCGSAWKATDASQSRTGSQRTATYTVSRKQSSLTSESTNVRTLGPVWRLSRAPKDYRPSRQRLKVRMQWLALLRPPRPFMHLEREVLQCPGALEAPRAAPERRRLDMVRE